MPTIEERLQALEREHTELKKTIELQNIAIGALVNKAALERLNEKYDKIFDALMAHDHLTNERLGDIQNQLIEQDGKIVGLQTEMRQRFNETDQRFNEQDSKIAGLDNKVAGLQTEMRQHFNEQDSKITNLQTTQTEHTDLLKQILARLPQQP